MIFNSFQFLWLFPLIFVVYYSLQILLPYDKEKVNKITNYSLIVISYGLYVQYKPAYALLLLGVTVVTYFFAIKIEKENSYFKKKNIILVGGILTLLPLGIFKYYNFINTSFANFFSYFGISTSIPGLNIAVPLGISFF
jgi:alginate O-acetyltransferase complex protein AlgI